MNPPDTSADQTPDLKLEIAHLLLIDVVGYSTLLVNEQVELLRELNRVVRNTKCFGAAEASGKLIRVPTGDGMALLFFNSPEEPVQCALEITQALKDAPNIRLRMGIHSGPVNRITDVNDRLNVAGVGINVAQRIMDCGDSGHILLSKHVADDLAQYRHWRPYLHEIGECEVKHGLRLHIVNLCKDGLGNPQLPGKLRGRRRWQQTALTVRPVSKSRWPQILVGSALLLSLVAIATSLWIFFRGPEPLAAPEKSIAVLPLTTLGESNAQNTHLTDGLHDEIITDLAKVADLKVISRTSVMPYKAALKHNLREIGRQLGVTHILEGSFQRLQGRVRVTVQLIDARTDHHVWAERYDRELADVFTLESELSEKIVQQLKSKLSPQEKAAIAERPTADLIAYDLYVDAKNRITKAVFTAPRTDSLYEAIHLLDQAVSRDPKFFLAHCQLAHAHDQLYLLGADHTPERLALANSAIQSVLRLRPDSGEARLALAKHLYWGYRDYDRAREELAAARTLLPNDPWPLVLIGYIDRRQGRWDESTQNLERALTLDPRNPMFLQQISLSYECLRRYTDMAGVLDRALLLIPKDVSTRLRRSLVDLERRADTGPLHSTVHAILAENPNTAPVVAEHGILLAMCERDPDAAAKALQSLSPDGCRTEGLPFPRAWCEAMVAQQKGDSNAARKAFEDARTQIQAILRDQPDYAGALCVLGMIDASLGRKEEAIQEGRRAVELLPVEKDAIDGALLVQYLAIIYMRTGEMDLALEQLKLTISIPGYLSYGELCLHPIWDPLRGDPKFKQIVASLKPK